MIEILPTSSLEMWFDEVISAGQKMKTIDINSHNFFSMRFPLEQIDFNLSISNCHTRWCAFKISSYWIEKDADVSRI